VQLLGEHVGLGSLAAPVTVEGSFVFPGGPDDTSQTIGERDSGFVMSPLPFAIERPALQSVETLAGSLRPVSTLQRGACAVDDQGFADTRRLLWRFCQAAPFGTGSFTGVIPSQEAKWRPDEKR